MKITTTDGQEFQDGVTVSGPLSAFMQPGPLRDQQIVAEQKPAKPIAFRMRADAETSTIYIEP